MKRKIVALMLIGCMTASMTAFAEESTEGVTEGATEAGTEAAADFSDVETVAEGKLTVATSPDFAPYEFYAIDEDGTPSLAGFDIALAQYIADYMGLELEVVTVDFDGVLTELQTKSVDLGMAGLSPDPAREAIMDFSDIYYEGGQSLVTVKDNADKYNSFDAVNNSDVSVGAQTGSIQLDLANENTPDADIISLPKVTDIIAELLAGKLDAAYIETAVAESYQKNYPDLEIVMDVPYDVKGSSIGVCKDNEGLMKAVNAAIAAAKEDGSLEDFIAEANALAAGEKYEGLLDDNGEAAEASTEAVAE